MQALCRAGGRVSWGSRYLFFCRQHARDPGQVSRLVIRPCHLREVGGARRAGHWRASPTRDQRTFSRPKPASRARTMAWARVLMPSLARIADTWLRAVRSLMWSRAPIAPLSMP